MPRGNDASRRKKKKEEKNRVPFKVNNSGRVARIHPSVRPVCKHFAPFNVTGVFFMFSFFLCPTERKKKILPHPKVPPGLEKKCDTRTNKNTTTEAPQQRQRQSSQFCMNNFAKHEPCDRLQASTSSCLSRRHTHSG